MPIDASIPLQVQTPQLDLGQIYGVALQLKQMQQDVQSQNTLKQMLAQPGAIDEQTGLPTTNTLAAFSKLFPAQGLKLSEQIGTAQEHRAQVAHLESETNKDQQAADLEATQNALGAYDAALQGGGTSPDIALTDLRRTLHDHIYERPYSKARNDADWAQVSQASPAQLRAASLTAQQRAEAEKRTPYFDPATNKTVFVGSEADSSGAVPVTTQEGKPVELTGPIAKSSAGGQPKFYQNAAGDMISYRPNTGWTNETTGEHLTGPPDNLHTVSSGAARSAPAMATQLFIQQYAKGHGGQLPSADALAEFQGGYQATVLAGTSGVKADTSSLTNLTKILDSSDAFENTAMANFRKAQSLAPKGIKTNMGPFIERYIQDGEKAIGDPSVPAYQAALLTAANEYAKVIAGSTGSQGSTVDSRREATEMFSSFYNTDQINGVIDVGMADMRNKMASYEGQREAIKERIAGENPGGLGGPGGGGTSAAPGGASSQVGAYKSATDVASAYHSGKLSRDQASKILRDNGWAR